MFELLKSFFRKKPPEPPFKVGDKIKFILGTPIHGFKIGGVYTVSSLFLGGDGQIWFVRVDEVTGFTYCSDFRLAELGL